MSSSYPPYPLSALQYDPRPINCRSSLYDGFSGWYAVSDSDRCTDFCFWEVYGSGPTPAVKAATSDRNASSADASTTDADEGESFLPARNQGEGAGHSDISPPGELRCSLDMNTDCSISYSSSSSYPALLEQEGEDDGEEEPQKEVGPPVRYNALNTADPHFTTSLPGVAEWRCALNVGGDGDTWSDLLSPSGSIDSERLTDPGAFGPTFQYLRCHRGSNEVLNNAGRVVANSLAFWSVFFVVCVVGWMVLGAWLWRRRRIAKVKSDGSAGVYSDELEKREDDGAAEKKQTSSVLVSDEREYDDEPAGQDKRATNESDCIQVENEEGLSSSASFQRSDAEAGTEAAEVGEESTHGPGDETGTGQPEEAALDPSASKAVDNEATAKNLDDDDKMRDEEKQDQFQDVSKSTAKQQEGPRKCAQCRRCCAIFSLVALGVLLTVGLVWSLMSVIEIGGNTLYSDGASMLTPKCVDPKSVCSEGNVDVDRPSSSPRDDDESAFSYLVASDAQLDWWDGESSFLGKRNVPPPCDERTDTCSSCTEKVAGRTNSLMRGTFEELVAQKEEDGGEEEYLRPTTLIMNGDLSAYFHPHEVSSYEKYYRSIPGVESYFPSLGNHDVSHFNGARYGADQWFGPANCNMKHAEGYIRGAFCNKVPGLDPARIVRYDASSLAYSWEQGRYHFVHLHYYPAYESATIGLKSSVTWLDRDLRLAKEANLTSVVFVHAEQGLPISAENAILGKNVKAIFAGHSHRCFMRKCVFLSSLRMSDVFPNRTSETPPTEEEISATSPPPGSAKCVPGGYAVCGGWVSGGNGMNLWFLANKTNDDLVFPDTKLYYESNDSGGLCGSPEPVFVNITDNTLLCKGNQVGYPEFPPIRPGGGEGGERIPVFWSGSASFETFLKVDFLSDRIVVNPMTASEEEGASSTSSTSSAGAGVGGGQRGHRFLDIHEVPNAVYPYHNRSDVEEAVIWI